MNTKYESSQRHQLLYASRCDVLESITFQVLQYVPFMCLHLVSNILKQGFVFLTPNYAETKHLQCSFGGTVSVGRGSVVISIFKMNF